MEFRFFAINKKVLQQLFKALAKNRSIQKLILTHGALNYAKTEEYQLLGESLANNSSLFSLDMTENPFLNENLAYHQDLTDSLAGSSVSKLEQLWITTESLEIKSHYLGLIDSKPQIVVFTNKKMLEDVDI